MKKFKVKINFITQDMDSEGWEITKEIFQQWLTEALTYLSPQYLSQQKQKISSIIEENIFHPDAIAHSFYNETTPGAYQKELEKRHIKTKEELEKE